MTKEEKIRFLKQSFSVLEGLTRDINQKMAYAKEGVEENKANLIIGGLADIDKAALHLKSVYETMLFMHRN
ncbi:MAG: hypothetical protein FWF35_04155 [Elusimicrobia bacterium]|nr:hypothetical protein [Elusimicrobiota bacterium]